MLASLALAGLLVCGLAAVLAGLGIHIDGWARWAGYASRGIQPGSQADLLAGVGQALPDKIACGGRWLMVQPDFARMNDLERQQRLDEAASLCQRAAQLTLGCVPTSSVTAQCFRLDKKIAIRQCRATCDPVICKAARMSCDQ